LVVKDAIDEVPVFVDLGPEEGHLDVARILDSGGEFIARHLDR
jgi:hypothetical protein